MSPYVSGQILSSYLTDNTSDYWEETFLNINSYFKNNSKEEIKLESNNVKEALLDVMDLNLEYILYQECNEDSVIIISFEEFKRDFPDIFINHPYTQYYINKYINEYSNN